MSVVDTSGLREQVVQSKPRAGKTIKQAVAEQMAQIARALPRATGMTPERFTRLVMTEISRNPRLAECSVQSFLGAMMYAAQLGVEPGPLGHAYLVPFGDTVQFILGYKGMIALARRSGDIQGIEARAVHENDEFEWAYGLEDVLVHRPALDNRGDPIRYYGIARFKDGGHYFLVMSKAEVEKRRARSRAKNSGPWTSDYEAMALKTVIRAMQPYLPLTSEVATAIEVDERVTATFDPDAGEMLQIREEPYEDVPELVAETPDEPGAQDAGPVEATSADDTGSASESESVEVVGELLEVDINDELVGADLEVGLPEDVVDVDLPPMLDSYDGMLAGQLAQECINRGLSNTGTKPVLVARLREDDAKPF